MSHGLPSVCSMAKHIELGAWGEEVAARAYRRRGYEILARNWRCSSGEIDLIARKGRQIVIVEVKTRRTANYGHPLEAVNEAKQQRIHRLANQWRAENKIKSRRFRYDVASVLRGKVEIYPGVF